MESEKKIKIEYPKGYWMEAKTEIINLSLSNAKLKYRNPYNELAKLLFRFFKTEDVKANRNNKFSHQEVIKYFGIQNTLVEEILRSLLKDGFIKKLNEEEYQINEQKILDLYSNPYKIWIRNLNYYFSRFPRIFIPDFLISFADIRLSERVPVFRNELDMNLISHSKIRNLVRLPEQFIGLSEDSTQNHYNLKTKANVSFIPLDEKNNFLGIINHKNPFNWPLERRIIEKDHPDYSKIRDWLNIVNIGDILQDCFPQSNEEFDYDLIFNDSDNSWILKAKKINYKVFEELRQNLNKLNFKLNLKDKLQYIDIPISQPIIKDFEGIEDFRIKGRFQVQIDSESAFTFFTHYLERRIANRSVNYQKIDVIIQELYEEFINFYELNNTFKKPTKRQLRAFYWSNKIYELAYFFMYQIDFHYFKAEYNNNPNLKLYITHNKEKKKEIKNKIIEMINSAEKNIKISNWLINLDDIKEALIKKAKELRGHVYILIAINTNNLKFQSKQRYGDNTIPDETEELRNYKCLRELSGDNDNNASIAIHGHPNSHAKFIITDDNKAMITSANLTHASLENGNRPWLNRNEVGLYIEDLHIVKNLCNIYEKMYLVYYQAYFPFNPPQEYEKVPSLFPKHLHFKERQKTNFLNSQKNYLELIWTIDIHELENRTLSYKKKSILNKFIDILNKDQEYLYIISFSFKDLIDCELKNNSNLQKLLIDKINSKKGKINLIIDKGQEKFIPEKIKKLNGSNNFELLLHPGIHSKFVLTPEEWMIFTANLDGEHGLNNSFEVGVIGKDPSIHRELLNFFNDMKNEC